MEKFTIILIYEIFKKKGYSFKSNSDAETLAASYDYWGEKLIEKLEGQYAFFALNIDENKGILVRDGLVFHQYTMLIIMTTFILVLYKNR